MLKNKPPTKMKMNISDTTQQPAMTEDEPPPKVEVNTHHHKTGYNCGEKPNSKDGGWYLTTAQHSAKKKLHSNIQHSITLQRRPALKNQPQRLEPTPSPVSPPHNGQGNDLRQNLKLIPPLLQCWRENHCQR